MRTLTRQQNSFLAKITLENVKCWLETLPEQHHFDMLSGNECVIGQFVQHLMKDWPEDEQVHFSVRISDVRIDHQFYRLPVEVTGFITLCIHHWSLEYGLIAKDALELVEQIKIRMLSSDTVAVAAQ